MTQSFIPRRNREDFAKDPVLNHNTLIKRSSDATSARMDGARVMMNGTRPLIREVRS